MTQPRIEHIKLVRGDDFGAEFTFDQPIANFSAMVFVIRDKYATTQTDNADAVFHANLTPTGTDKARVDVPSATTVALQDTRYVYDVSVVTLAGKQYQTQRGAVAVDPDVGR